MVVGTSRAAIIHVGTAFDAKAEPHDGMDADSGNSPPAVQPEAQVPAAVRQRRTLTCAR